MLQLCVICFKTDHYSHDYFKTAQCMCFFRCKQVLFYLKLVCVLSGVMTSSQIFSKVGIQLVAR